MHTVTAILLALALTACTTQPGPMITRQDGQSILNIPANYAKAEADRAACDGERAKAFGTTVDPYARQQVGYAVWRGCLADRGYVVQ
jgi:starvation-inducible outer membrane lipoprotein